VSEIDDLSNKSLQSLIVFDGACIMCSAFADFIVRHDHKKQFLFTTAQSPLGLSLYAQYGLRTDIFETNIVIIDGVAHQKMDSLIAALDALGWPWRAVSVLKLLPKPLRNTLYDFIARNRHRFFGRKDNCDIPSAALRARIVE
jgi:predicted DCC family thiol-disulfide oxidoreductase YuxK